MMMTLSIRLLLLAYLDGAAFPKAGHTHSFYTIIIGINFVLAHYYTTTMSLILISYIVVSHVARSSSAGEDIGLGDMVRKPVFLTNVFFIHAPNKSRTLSVIGGNQ